MTRKIADMPQPWATTGVTLVMGAAILPALAAAIFERFPAIAAPLLLALGLSFTWQLLFARMRNQAMRWDGLLTATVFVMLLPAQVPLWQMALALSFGLVFGDLIFGERGRSFLNAATVGLAFLIFSFPGIVTAPLGLIETIAAAVSGAILLGLGLLSWRIVAAFTLGVAIPFFMLNGIAELRVIPTTSLMLGLVFLIGDPLAAACTNAGRWIYGGLAGGLVVLLGQTGDGVGSLSSIVFAALLASILAPMIDQIVIQFNVRRRARRQAHA